MQTMQLYRRINKDGNENENIVDVYCRIID